MSCFQTLEGFDGPAAKRDQDRLKVRSERQKLTNKCVEEWRGIGNYLKQTQKHEFKHN